MYAYHTTLSCITQAWKTEWGKGRKKKKKRKNLQITFGLNENDCVMFCCLPTAFCAKLHHPEMSICSAVNIEHGHHSLGALMRSRNVEKGEERKKHFINFPTDTLNWQANHLERLWKSHQHKYKTECLL